VAKRVKNQIMSGFIYVWYDRKHKRYYIGSHWGSPDDGYICSSSWMKKAYRLRTTDFKRRIVATAASRSDLIREEQRWLDMMDDDKLAVRQTKDRSKVRYYNFMKRADHLWHVDDKKRESVAERLSILKKGKPLKFSDPSERARKISETKRRKFEEARAAEGHSFSEETRAKMAQKKIGTRYSDERRLAHSEVIRKQWAEGRRSPK
jgi:hypothetical protein